MHTLPGMRSCVVVFYLILTCLAINLGYDHNTYKQGDKVELLVNKIESDNTQLPYGYYDLPFVCPAGPSVKPLALSLGELLKGDRTWQSNYQLLFGIDAPCLRLCDLIVRDHGLKKADELIRKGYVAHWLVDGLPGATTFVSGNNDNKYYAAGFPLGFVDEDILYIYNHVMLVMRYHKDKLAKGKHVIVGFEVYPKSVSNEICPGSSKDYDNFALTFDGLALAKKNTKKGKDKDSKEKSPAPNADRTVIPFTYSVYWREDNTIDYDSRWDLYYKGESGSKNSHIHWISFINSIVLLSLLSLAVALVLARVLRSDLQKVTKTPFLPTDDKSDEEGHSWRRLVSEVHNKPSFSFLISLFVSSGLQTLIVVVAVITMFTINSQFSLDNLPLNMFFNNHQGAFFSLTIAFFAISSIVPSYVGIILHKIFQNENLNSQLPPPRYMKLSLMFSGFLPLIISLIVLFMNFFVWAKSSSYALPFGTIVVFLFLFFAFHLPLGIIGGYYGNKQTFDNKSFIMTSFLDQNRDSRGGDSKKYVSRKRLPFFLQTTPSIILFGLIPFGIVYVELLFIFNSLWLEKTTFYFMYGFLLITTLILIIVIAESAILATYLSLAIFQNPKWHWLCFRVGSSIGFYIMAYSTYYFFFALNIRDFVSILLYFSYMVLVSGLISLACGAVGLITGLIFIGKIYGTIKID